MSISIWAWKSYYIEAVFFAEQSGFFKEENSENLQFSKVIAYELNLNGYF
jgi:hypothetical protein